MIEVGAKHANVSLDKCQLSAQWDRSHLNRTGQDWD